MNIKKLSIIVPAYNEAKTIEEILRKAAGETQKLGIEEEIIVVDDASTDNTQDVLTSLAASGEVAFRTIQQERNQGKGAALKRGFLEATGDVVLVQDADLEYDPADYRMLLQPIIDKNDRADVVYGSRFRGEIRKVGYFWNSVGNKFVTHISNFMLGLNLTDMETGYKVFRSEVIKRIAPTLRSSGFDIEPELTAKVAKGKWRLREVPVSYAGRTYEEGKKIGWRDGLAAIWAIIKFRFRD
jgi:glycosyltransferase involved in cell wall biosynthesis